MGCPYGLAELFSGGDFTRKPSELVERVLGVAGEDGALKQSGGKDEMEELEFCAVRYLVHPDIDALVDFPLRIIQDPTIPWNSWCHKLRCVATERLNV